MADIDLTDVRTQFLNRVKALVDSSITWGNNSYPVNADWRWFGGSTSGSPYSPSEAYLDSDGRIDASVLRDGLLYYLNLYSRIRRTRILIYRTRSGYSNNSSRLIYDYTRYAHLSSSYGFNVPDPSWAGVQEGTPVDQSMLYDFIEGIRSKYWEHCRGTSLLTLTRSVCHDSCHDNCHDSRGRR